MNTALSAKQVVEKVKSGELTAREIAKEFLVKAESINSKTNCILHLDAEAVIRAANKADEAIAARGASNLPLAGLPIIVKDNISVHGSPTTCGSKILENYTAPYDATVIRLLQEAGAFVLAKANMDEFAMGSSNETSSYGPVRNPWDLEFVPGGSSGGSAAAVAARLAPVSLGTDTGGSIRQPASFCGVVGLKPTYGAVSRAGLVAFASSLDQIGPMTSSVADAALILDVIAKNDPLDSTSLTHPDAGEFFAALDRKDQGLKGKTIGLPTVFFQDGLDSEVAEALDQTVHVIRSLGANIKKIDLPHVAYSVAAYYVIATAEASSNLARFDGIRYGFRAKNPNLSLRDLYRETRSQGFGQEVKQRIMLGTFVLSSGYYDAFYAKANRVRELISRDFESAFASGVDLILTPTSPVAPFKLGEKLSDPLAMYLADICTIGVNLAGLPAVSVPCGRTASGLPIGAQFIAPKFQEKKLLAGAYAYESATEWSGNHPVL